MTAFGRGRRRLGMEVGAAAVLCQDVNLVVESCFLDCVRSSSVERALHQGEGWWKNGVEHVQCSGTARGPHFRASKLVSA